MSLQSLPSELIKAGFQRCLFPMFRMTCMALINHSLPRSFAGVVLWGFGRRLDALGFGTTERFGPPKRSTVERPVQGRRDHTVDLWDGSSSDWMNWNWGRLTDRVLESQALVGPFGPTLGNWIGVKDRHNMAVLWSGTIVSLGNLEIPRQSLGLLCWSMLGPRLCYHTALLGQSSES